MGLMSARPRGGRIRKRRCEVREVVRDEKFRKGVGMKNENKKPPPFRKLSSFAFDPSLDRDLHSSVINRVTLTVPWEKLEPGPVGEYVEVIDIDPASNACYAPVDLDDPYLLANNGLDPTDGDPKFHQQMVYAVAMTTIRNFELALGRRALWSPSKWNAKTDKSDEELYVQRLRLHPHALREANAYYSPDKKAVLFGYFPAPQDRSLGVLPGGTVFTCLSHDVIAHEVTHALLDGMHRRFVEPSNPDVLAFHEAFADIVALFQRFSYTDVLKHQIARTRGDLQTHNLLGQLAQEVGKAIGHYGALRDALGSIDPQTGKWVRQRPNPKAIDETVEPHARGAILVAAVFDAFVAIYEARIADLLRLASNGTGILAPGAIHPDLVNRLTQEAAKTSKHVLTLCIRALDYCPAVDITFGEYLRALITADYDLVPDDPLNYRGAFIEAFCRRGIFPPDVRSLSVDSVRWLGPTDEESKELGETIFRHMQSWGKKENFRDFLYGWDLSADRKAVYTASAKLSEILHKMIKSKDIKTDAMFRGLDPSKTFQISSLRPTRRVGPNGNFISELVVGITQSRREFFTPERAASQTGILADANGPYDFYFRGGCTLVMNLDEKMIRYNIFKNITSQTRLKMQREYAQSLAGDSLYATYFGGQEKSVREPFAVLHRHL